MNLESLWKYLLCFKIKLYLRVKIVVGHQNKEQIKSAVRTLLLDNTLSAWQTLPTLAAVMEFRLMTSNIFVRNTDYCPSFCLLLPTAAMTRIIQRQICAVIIAFLEERGLMEANVVEARLKKDRTYIYHSLEVLISSTIL